MGGQMWKETCKVNPDSPLCSWTKPFDRFFEETIIGKMFINFLILCGVSMIVYTIDVSFKEELNKRKVDKNDQARQTKRNAK